MFWCQQKVVNNLKGHPVNVLKISLTLNSGNRCSMSMGVEESIAAAGVSWADQKSFMPFDDTSTKTRNCRLYQIGPCSD